MFNSAFQNVARLNEKKKKSRSKQIAFNNDREPIADGELRTVQRVYRLRCEPRVETPKRENPDNGFHLI